MQNRSTKIELSADAGKGFSGNRRRVGGMEAKALSWGQAFRNRRKQGGMGMPRNSVFVCSKLNCLNTIKFQLPAGLQIPVSIVVT